MGVGDLRWHSYVHPAGVGLQHHRERKLGQVLRRMHAELLSRIQALPANVQLNVEHLSHHFGLPKLLVVLAP